MVKKDIIQKISKNCELSSSDSSKFFNLFIKIITTKSKKYNIKLTNFGSFKYKLTAKRIGRNPISKESYIIQPFNKLVFNPSNVTRKILN